MGFTKEEIISARKDKQTADKLFTTNVRLFYHAINNILHTMGQVADTREYLSLSYMTYVAALKSYRVESKRPFSSYVYHGVKQRVRNYIVENDQMTTPISELIGREFENSDYDETLREEENENTREYVELLLNDLPEKWRVITHLYYGTGGYMKLTMRVISQLFGVSVQQIHNVLRSVREYIRTERELTKTRSQVNAKTDFCLLEKIKAKYHVNGETE